MIRVFTPVVVAVLGMMMAVPLFAGVPLEVGQPAPVIELPTLGDGGPMSLADFRGQRVVLHVFASW